MALVAVQEDGRYVLHYDYSPRINSLVKLISDYHFDGRKKQWSVPATPHAAKRLEKIGFNIEGKPNVKGSRAYFGWMKDYPLRPYQREGIRTLAKDFDLTGFLADGIGLGKTVQVIGALRSRKDGLPALIGCPAFLKEHWRRELEIWYPKAVVCVLSGRKKPGSAIPPKSDFVIIIYEIIDSWFELILNHGFKTVVFDECHRLKRASAKLTQSSLAIGRQADNAICVSGTPIESRPIEFFNILRLLAPHEFYDYEKFGMRYCDPTRNKYAKYGYDFDGASHSGELNEKLKHFMIRRRKTDVLLELPEKQRSIIPVEVNLKEYRRQLRQYIDACNLDEFDSGHILARIEGCKQAAARAKMPAAVAWIGEFLASGDKLVVYATHREILDGLEKVFPACARVDGSMTTARKQEEIDRFQNDPDCRLFIGNLKVAGVGISLTAASATLTLELGWTPGEHDQAEDRVHRIGQTADYVNAYYMVAKDTIEEQIFELLVRKRQALAAVLDGEEARVEDLFQELYRMAREAQDGAERLAERLREPEMPVMAM